jgi:hypothetical protein|eukprot:COSAG01_NODE_638_length_14605_cov_46.266097_5_plen_111_part_00
MQTSSDATSLRSTRQPLSHSVRLYPPNSRMTLAANYLTILRILPAHLHTSDYAFDLQNGWALDPATTITTNGDAWKHDEKEKKGKEEAADEEEEARPGRVGGRGLKLAHM